MPPGSPVRVACVALGLALGGCNSASTQPPEQPQVETAKPAEPAEPRVGAPTADATAAQRFASGDGRVSASMPAGDAWECLEQVSEDPPATLVKCRQRDRSRFFFMMAKVYSVPAAEVRSLEGILREVLPATYAKLFDSFTITREEPAIVGSISARDLWISAEHASKGTIKKRERVMVADDRVFIVSAEGIASIFDEESAAIDAWFAGARFTDLP